MNGVCTIRSARHEDLPEIHRLLDQANLPDVPALRADDATTHTYLLVLDAPDRQGLSAVALVVVEGDTAQVSLLAVDLRYQNLGIEDRLIGVSEALCRAFDARRLEVRSAPLHH